MIGKVIRNNYRIIAVKGVVLLAVVGGVLLAGCGPKSTPTSAPVAAQATTPAATVLPTATPVPLTATPTYTPVPTDTPSPTPTATFTPTSTPLPPTPTDTPSPPTPTPSPTPSGGRIAFVSERDGDLEIYMMYAGPSAGSGHGGSGQTRLTNNPDYDGGPSWSPDGTRIVFVSNREGNHPGIYVMDADGGGVTCLAGGWAPSWSPDGAHIAYTDDYKWYSYIWVMNADGSGEGRFLLKSDWGFNQNVVCAWSPDGTRIAFGSDRDSNWEVYHDSNWEVYVVNVDSSEVARLTNNPTDDWPSSWSPDGTRIAFESERDGNWEIYVMNADPSAGSGQGGSGQTNLTNHPADDRSPSWSPDGTRIVFTSERDGNLEIYVMNADGSGQTNLTNHAADDRSPSWSPDGTRIVFDSNRDEPEPRNCHQNGQPECNYEIYVMNADPSTGSGQGGRGVTRLTNSPAYDGAPTWGP